MRRTEKSRNLLYAISICAILAIITAASGPVRAGLDAKASRKSIQTAVQLSNAPDRASAVVYSPEDGLVPDIEPDVQMLLDMDLELLRDCNKDVVAWLYLPDTDLSLPVLSGQEYAVLDWTGGRSDTGSLTAQDPGLDCLNLIFTGSHELMPDVARMADTTRNFAEYHQSIYLRTNTGIRAYHVFSAYQTDNVLTALRQPDGSQYADWIKACYGKTSVRVPPGPGSAAQVLTVVTPVETGFAVVHFGLAGTMPLQAEGAA